MGECEVYIWGDVGKSVKGSIGVEVRGVKNVRWNRVSPDSLEPGNVAKEGRDEGRG